MEELIDHINENNKLYEITGIRRDKDYSLIDSTNEIVRQFIIERKLILFGGLALDYALRLKGSKIYPDDQNPDFDFYSPDSVNDANDLADILYNLKYENINVIRGIHAQTMKVRVNFIWVADIGYVPQEIFDTIPTIDYMGMRIVHPHYQIIDQHLAFCYPLDGAPMENINHRWRKDIKRYNLIDEYYPIEYKEVSLNVKNEVGTFMHPAYISETNNSDTKCTDITENLNFAINGLAAYALMRKSLELLMNTFKITDIKVKAPKHQIIFNNEYNIEMDTLPEIPGFDIVTPYPNEILKKINKYDTYEPYMDAYPTSYKYSNVTILSTKNHLLAVTAVQVISKTHDNCTALIVSPQYLLMWFMHKYHRCTDRDIKNLYMSYYIHTREIINCAESIYDKLIKANPEKEKEILFNFIHSPFALSVNTLGKNSNSLSYLLRIGGHIQRFKDTPPEFINMNSEELQELLSNLPMNYYPDRKTLRKVFDYKSSKIFKISGKLITR